MSDGIDREEILKNKVREQMPEFTDAVDNAPLAKLEMEMLKYANHREEVDMAKQKDPDLNKAKEEVKMCSATYNEQLKALKLKMAYLGLLIAEKKASV